MFVFVFLSSRRRHTICALVTGLRRVLFRSESTGLFDDPSPAPSTEGGPRIRVPRQLLDELEMAARYRTEQRWSLLYRVLWRVTQGDSSARMVGDIDGSELHGRIKAVRREAHHLHAFLRFRPLQTIDGPRHLRSEERRVGKGCVNRCRSR